MAQSVKLSAETIALLKVVSTINNSGKLEAGNVIKTVSPSGAIILEAEIAETFPETFSIYELSRLLSVLNLPSLKDAELIFDNKNYVEIKSGKTKVNYKFTSEHFVEHPGRKVVLPTQDLIVDIDGEELNNITKMASVLGHKILEFRVLSGKAYLTTTSPDLGDTSNDSLVELADVPDAEDAVYRLKFDNVILPAGDYRVTICRGGISNFSHKTRKIQVFVGLERA